MVGTIPTSAQPLQSRLEQEAIAAAGTGVLGEDWERVRASTIEAVSLEGVKGPKMRRSLRAERVIGIGKESAAAEATPSDDLCRLKRDSKIRHHSEILTIARCSSRPTRRQQ
ncbi:hypothetical protein LINPERHAP1_LOCUS34999 [Linum perenne]